MARGPPVVQPGYIRHTGCVLSSMRSTYAIGDAKTKTKSAAYEIFTGTKPGVEGKYSFSEPNLIFTESLVKQFQSQAQEANYLRINLGLKS